MKGYNQVKHPHQLNQGDRILLEDSYADVLDIVSVNESVTVVLLSENGGTAVTISLDNTLFLELASDDT